MTYFKNKPAKVVKRPYIFKILAIQVLASILLALVAALTGWLSSLSVFVGGGIATLGQAYYNVRSMKRFASYNAAKTIGDIVVGMSGKWVIVISLSLISIVSFAEYIQAGALYAGLFVVYLLGVFLLPILVKTSL